MRFTDTVNFIYLMHLENELKIGGKISPDSAISSRPEIVFQSIGQKPVSTN